MKVWLAHMVESKGNLSCFRKVLHHPELVEFMNTTYESLQKNRMSASEGWTSRSESEYCCAKILWQHHYKIKHGCLLCRKQPSIHNLSPLTKLMNVLQWAVLDWQGGAVCRAACGFQSAAVQQLDRWEGIYDKFYTVRVRFSNRWLLAFWLPKVS